MFKKTLLAVLSLLFLFSLAVAIRFAVSGEDVQHLGGAISHGQLIPPFNPMYLRHKAGGDSHSLRQF